MDIPSKIYVVIDNERVEMSPHELDEKLTAGEVTVAALVWAKGMENWQPLSETPALLELLGREGPVAESARAHEPAAEISTSTADDDGDLGFDEAEDAQEETVVDTSVADLAESFVNAKPATPTDTAVEDKAEENEADALFGHTAADDGGGEGEEDIFAGKDDGMFPSGAVENGGTERPGAAADTKDEMVWQRHETSVLFSLSDVKEVKEKERVQATHEGIIDIKSIAEQASRENEGIDRIITGWESGLDAAEQETSSLVQDLDRVDSPLIQQKSNTALYVLIGLLVIVIGGLVAYMVMNGGEKQPLKTPTVTKAPVARKPVAPVAKAPAKKPVVTPVATPAAKTPAVAPGTAPGATATKDAAATPTAKKVVEEAPAPVKKPAAKKPAAKKIVEKAPAPAKKPAAKKIVEKAPAPAKKPAAVATAKKDADDILASIGSGGSASGSSTGNGKLPNKLSASAKKKAMDKYASKVQSCFSRFGNPMELKTVKVKMALQSDGKVRKASVVTKGLNGTPQGNCVQGILKKVRVDPFKAASDYVHYTYRIK